MGMRYRKENRSKCNWKNFQVGNDVEPMTKEQIEEWFKKNPNFPGLAGLPIVLHGDDPEVYVLANVILENQKKAWLLENPNVREVYSYFSMSSCTLKGLTGELPPEMEQFNKEGWVYDLRVEWRYKK